MVLAVGDSYTASNSITKVTQGAVTPEQKAWYNENRDKPINERPYLTLTPAQILYLALCKNGFHLKKALKSCRLNDAQKDEAQQALKILDDQGNLRVNGDGVVTKITRPSFVGADLQGRDLKGADLRDADLRYANLRDAVLRDANLYKAQMQGADLRDADLRDADLRWADLRGAFLRGADLRETQMQGAKLQWAILRGAQMQGADLWGADLRGAQLQGADLGGADLWKADISGANFNNAKNLKNASSLYLAFYHQNNPPKNLEDALNGVKENKRPMALTRQEYDNVCRLRNSNQLSFGQELNRLRLVCDKRIDSREQVDAAKPKFAWCKPLVSTKVAIMFSQGFNKERRDELYGEDAGGRVLQKISDGLEGLNHLFGRGSR